MEKCISTKLKSNFYDINPNEYWDEIIQLTFIKNDFEYISITRIPYEDEIYIEHSDQINFLTCHYTDFNYILNGNILDIKIKKVIFEGCSLWQNSWIQEFLLKKIFIKKHRKAVGNRELAVKKMTRLYGEKASTMADTFIAMDEDSILSIIHDCAFVELPVLTEREQKKCLFTYGSKELDLKGAKKFLPKNYPHANLKLWDGYGHCTKITRDNVEYCNFLRKEIDAL